MFDFDGTRAGDWTIRRVDKTDTLPPMENSQCLRNCQKAKVIAGRGPGQANGASPGYACPRQAVV